MSCISDGGDRTCVNTVVCFNRKVEWEPLNQQVMTQDLVSLVDMLSRLAGVPLLVSYNYCGFL